MTEEKITEAMNLLNKNQFDHQTTMADDIRIFFQQFWKYEYSDEYNLSRFVEELNLW